VTVKGVERHVGNEDREKSEKSKNVKFRKVKALRRLWLRITALGNSLTHELDLDRG
jgi:ribosomal 50S subunit-associated protein YjgA (DUF615 family)